MSESTRKCGVPKACVSCRRHKVKCDGQRPCTRCGTTYSECVYYETTKDPTKEKLEQLEQHVRFLDQRLRELEQRSYQQGRSVPPGIETVVQTSPALHDYRAVANELSGEASPISVQSPRSRPSLRQDEQPFESTAFGISKSHLRNSPVSDTGFVSFRIRRGQIPDIVMRNLTTSDDASLYFQNFFTGCDRFVPVFEPSFDGFKSIRSRSGILFDAICTVGCRMTTGPASQIYQLLDKELQKRICTIVVSSTEASLESIQALLVTACYSDKGWLLTSIATRMAMQLNLPGKYDEAVRLTASKDSLVSQNQGFTEANPDPEGIRDCFRKARTWLGLFVLESIFSLDRGKAPSIEAQDGIRRCRVLVSHPSRTPLDLRLLSQVELNHIRAGAHAELSATSHLGDADLAAFVQGIKIDLSIWLEDWLQIVGRSAAESEEQRIMIINLRIQRDWAVIIICCKALQYTGIKNIAFMSKEQHEIMYMAKESAQSHFEKLLVNPKLYLAPFRYTMDFVWAKCAFSVLLLLKLAILLPETSDLPKLLADSKHLLEELSNIHGPRNVYFRILKLSIEKAEKALNAYMVQVATVTDDAGRNELQNELASTFLGPQEAEFDFQTYAPKEFIFDWDFPSLTLCFVPIDIEALFSDFTNI